MLTNSFQENPKHLVEKHLRLSKVLPMTDYDIERLIEILELAESSDFFSCFLNENDDQPFNRSMELDSESPKYYQEQQRKTIECLDAIDKKVDSFLAQR